MSPIEVFKPESRAGRRAVERLVRRGDAVLDPKTLRKTAAIVRDVRRKGDRALLDYARKLDGATAESAAGLALAPTMEDPADLPAGFAEALERAIAAVERFHEPQRRSGYKLVEEEGVELEERITPLQRVGLYVPGGLASYPSSVLMNAVPARVAGVLRVAMVVPSPGGEMNPLVLAAAHLSGVSEIYRIGGAQAVAALAYGTQSVPAVAKNVECLT